MTLEERISLCRFLEKVEDQEAYCASIGVRDVSKFRGRVTSQSTGNAGKNRKQA